LARREAEVSFQNEGFRKDDNAMARPRIFEHVMTEAERARRYREKKKLRDRPWLAGRVPFRRHKPAESVGFAVTKLAPRDLARVLIA
jgi:hypothetical protein